ncbi:MAG: alpha-amylase family glycosyl hydrolase [Cyanobacteria bacterium J06597_16]
MASVKGLKKYVAIAAGLLFAGLLTEMPERLEDFAGATPATAQPTAIFHAFNQKYSTVETFACALADQGYSHIQLSPAQKSNPGGEWWKRYQPVDLNTIEGLGSEEDLQWLIETAHSCGVKIIADVVFNHMANLDGGDGFEDLSKYPGLSPADFNTRNHNTGEKPCDINYSDGNRASELDCWLGGLPDLKFTEAVLSVQKEHLQRLMDLGVDGFRFDAAKHMPPEVVQTYIDYINQQSGGRAWNYLEVISDRDTQATDYSYIATVTDFVLYNAAKSAFTYGGDLRSLPANAVDDSRSVTFGTNHDTIKSLNSAALNPYDDITDSYLATAYILAREGGTPLIFSADHNNAPFLKTGVKFRQIMRSREQSGKDVTENILRVLNTDTVVLMARGAEGLFVANKGMDEFDTAVLDLTLTHLDGCYRELRNNFTVAIEWNNNKKYVTQWGSWDRGSLEIQGRDALYFIREPFERCL